MDISLRHVCGTIIEMTVECDGTTITASITDLNSRVDEQFIQDLRDIADSLEEHNKTQDNENSL